MPNTVPILVLALTTCIVACSAHIRFKNCGYVNIDEIKVDGCSSDIKDLEDCKILYGDTVNVTAVISDKDVIKDKKYKSSEALIAQYGYKWKIPVSLEYGKSHLQYKVSIVTGKTELLKRPAILTLKSYHEKGGPPAMCDFQCSGNLN